jgi:hypothetical protein
MNQLRTRLRWARIWIKANKGQLWQWGLIGLVLLLLGQTAREPLEAEVLILRQIVGGVGALAVIVIVIRHFWTSIIIDVENSCDLPGLPQLSLVITIFLRWYLLYMVQLWVVGQWGDGWYQWWVARPHQSAIIATFVALTLPFLIGILGYVIVRRLFRWLEQRRYRLDSIQCPDSIVPASAPLPVLIQMHDPLCRECKFRSGSTTLLCAINPKHQIYDHCSEFEQKSSPCPSSEVGRGGE